MYTHNGNYLKGTLRTAMIKRQSSWDCRADGRTDLFIHIGRHYSYEHGCERKRRRTNNIINSYQSYERWTLQYNVWNRKNETIRISELRRLQWRSKGTVCILMRSLYELTGTGAAFRSKPHFIPYMYSCKSDFDHKRLVMMRTYNYKKALRR